MGWWDHGADGSSLHCEPTGLMWGDGPAEAVYWMLYGTGRKALKRCRKARKREAMAPRRIRAAFYDAFNRPPTKEEMVAGLLFHFGTWREFIAGLPDGPAPSAPSPGPFEPSHVHDWRWSQLFVTHSYNTGEGWLTAEWMCLRCAARGRIDRPAVTDFREGRRYAGPEAPVIQET